MTLPYSGGFRDTGLGQFAYTVIAEQVECGFENAGSNISCGITAHGLFAGAPLQIGIDTNHFGSITKTCQASVMALTKNSGWSCL